MELLGLAGIIIGIVLFLVLAYKGWSTLWVAPVCAVIVAIFNQLNPVTAIANNYVSGMTDVIISLFSLIFMGAVFGKVYAETGAASSIAVTLVNKFVLPRKGEGQVKAAVFVILIVSAIFTFGGVDAFVVVFTLFPIIMVVAEKTDIPRKFVPALLCLGAPFIAAPGAPQHINIMVMQALKAQGIEISPTAGLVPGFVSVIIIAVLSYFTVVRLIIKSKAKGDKFEMGEAYCPPVENRELPNFWVALIPLLVVFILFLVFHEVLIALGAGIILAIILMFKYMVSRGDGCSEITLGKAIINSINTGAGEYPNALISIVTPSGLAAVIASTAAFGMVIGIFYGMQVHYMIAAIIVISIVVALTSSPPAAIFISIPIIMGIVGQSGMIPNIPGIARVVALASTTFETLPANGFVLLILGLSKIKHKEGYLPVFLMTVAYTLVGTVIAAVMFMLFPGLG